ncbi:gas vesicle protein GvpO [Plantactinospora sp. KLBMP9567]|uniref:gas vesicle protein GvpO n=1 Tax=Plantactinospora sp. KLBMP9567 TaxID=3085900 RepID=UPI002980C93A|nr:gas vesicle protein GvpO [Plantactinospora sp. KLBMP9567]MDW5328265.1 gas vesicle protein GvpO [Plantactinospora sp. KLBMP9567]
MAARTHRADRYREHDGYPDQADDHREEADYREEDDRPDDYRYDDDADERDRTDDEAEDKYDDDQTEDEDEDEYEYDDDRADAGSDDQADNHYYYDDDRTEGRRRPARRRASPAAVVSAQVAARNGARHIAGLTGKQVTGVTSLDRTERGWVVGVEVVEDARVPSSADILAVYRTELDTGGELAGYRRTRRYPRGRGDSGTGAG